MPTTKTSWRKKKQRLKRNKHASTGRRHVLGFAPGSYDAAFRRVVDGGRLGLLACTRRKGWPPKKPMGEVRRKSNLARVRARGCLPHVAASYQISHLITLLHWRVQAKKSMRRLVTTLGSMSRGLVAALQDHKQPESSDTANPTFPDGKEPSGPRAEMRAPDGSLDWEYPVYTPQHLDVLVERLGIGTCFVWLQHLGCWTRAGATRQACACACACACA